MNYKIKCVECNNYFIPENKDDNICNLCAYKLVHGSLDGYAEQLEIEKKELIGRNKTILNDFLNYIEDFEYDDICKIIIQYDYREEIINIFLKDYK